VVIFICGFMGCGKTTFLEELQKLKEWNHFYDLDERIFQLHGEGFSNLAEMIRGKGWEKFRSLELMEISSIVKTGSSCVVSLGGGSLGEETLKLLQQADNAGLIWLDTPFGECLKRIRLNPQQRPLSSKTDGELLELYRKRIQYYQKADLVIGESEWSEYLQLGELLKKLQGIRHLGLT